MRRDFRKIVDKIRSLANELERSIRIMEVCGTHTEAIAKSGLRQAMPANVELVSGPGCPVCVTSQKDIDAIVALALNGVPIACYGDVLSVPGTVMSLAGAKSKGAQVFTVYSVEDALKICKKNTNLVFFGIGFETTAPMTASAVKRGLKIYSAHKLFPPAMIALTQNPRIRIDGFINPGHVSTIIGLSPYKKIRKPQVITGFMPEDVLAAVYMLLLQIKNGESKIENEYSRLVRPSGNVIAQNLLDEVFLKKDGEWRGFGKIPDSGLELKPKYKTQDAKVIFRSILEKVKSKTSNKGCVCDQVIVSCKKPSECKLFGKICTPENPRGACMVSREGACNVEYRFSSNV
ncbi:MAG: hypothetical protein ACD_63C00067G0002 [uncultured bacterium]|nr:MAG: hypothetical protein ACD_63C00067G0002 [uncultured bacterium]